jgi:hypothetical protein
MRRIRWLLATTMLGCGASDEKVCDWLVSDTHVCYDDYCDNDGEGTAFCDCWDQGMDLNITDCECIPLDLEAACDVLDLSDYQEGDFNCSAASDALSNVCD